MNITRTYMIKIFTATVVSGLLLFAGNRAVAQKQEVSLVVGAGPSGLHYSIKNGTSSLRQGFHAGVGYVRFFNSHWGLASGLELGYYGTKVKLDPNTVFSTYEMDSEGNAFEYRVRTKGYEEKQNLYAVRIPLLLQYQGLPKGNTQFYSRAGVQLSLPFNSRYNTSVDEISASGYYPDLNVEITDLPVHGFGTQTAWKKEGAYNFNLAYALAAEAGAKFRLSSSSFLSAGVFFEYGLNDLVKAKGNTALLTYNPMALSGSKANGVFSLANTTGNVHLLAFGIKLRIAFYAGKERRAVAAPATENVLPVQTQAPVKKEEKSQAEPVVDTSVIIERNVEKTATPHSLTQAEEATLKTPIRFNKVGDTALSAAAKAQADSLAAIMLQYPDVNVLIEGHTCDLGSDAVNNRIGLARANAVVRYLQQKGIDGSRMHAVTKGSEEPIVPNTYEINRKQNRRVVIKISDQ